MGMRIDSGGAAAAPANTSGVAQLQQRQRVMQEQSAVQSSSQAPKTPQPSRPTATMGNHLNEVV